MAGKCSLSILTSHLVPLMEELRERAICLWQDEHYLLASWNKPSSSLGAGLASGGESSPHQTEQEKLAEVSGHPLGVVIHSNIISFDLIQ